MNNVLFSSNYDSWTTPKDLFNKLNENFKFDIDACASDSNHLCNEYYTIENSILNKVFENKTIFMNPPYGRGIYPFIKWCYDMQHNNNEIVLLVPVRSDTKWFHDFIYNKQNVEIEFIKGRLRFGGVKGSAPFPSMLVYFHRIQKSILYGCCFKADLHIPGITYVDIIPNLNKSCNCEYLQQDIREINFNDYDIILCSPPCNYYSRANYRRDSSDYALRTKDLLPLCINKAYRSGKPFMIENVRNKNLFKKLQIPNDIFIYEYGRHTYFTNVMIDLNGVPQDEGTNNIQNISTNHRQGGFSVNSVFKWFLSVVLNKDLFNT